jgi:cyclopropane-fatty-acyl-phospholipid synthase
LRLDCDSKRRRTPKIYYKVLYFLPSTYSIAMSLHSTQLFRTTATHRNSLTGFLDSTWNTATETIAATTSSWFLDLAKSVVIRYQLRLPPRFMLFNNNVRALNHVEHGELHIVTPTEVFDFGSGQLSPKLKVELRVRRPTFWTRIVFFKELGFAEAFMYGDGEPLFPRRWQCK